MEENPYASPRSELPDDAADWSPPRIDAHTAIRMSGVMDWEDYRQAAALHVGGATSRSRTFYALILVFLLVLLLARYDVVTMAGGFVLMGLILFLLLVLLFLLLAGGLVRRGWDRAKTEPLVRLVTDEAIQTDTPSSTTIIRWSAFSKFKRSDEMVLLYSEPPVLYYSFPRSHCENELDWLSFVEMVERHLPRA